MANRKYIVTGPFPAYETQTGDPVTLDDRNAGVQANIAAGVVTLDPAATGAKVSGVPCPACAEQMKRPPKFATQADLAIHYGEKHPALVTPDIEEGE